jgi:hypothetical protein
VPSAPVRAAGDRQGCRGTEGLESELRIYINAQFCDGLHRTRLLSLGMVSEYGEWYRIVDDQGAVEHARKDPWIRQHVLTRLPWDEDGRDWFWDSAQPEWDRVLPKISVVDDMLDFVGTHPSPELWGWQSAYAYVSIRHLFGKLAERPRGFPEYCGELMAEWRKAGEPELPPRGVHGHHALEMARWARDVDVLLQS